MYLSIYLSSSPLYLHINLKSISYLYTIYHLSPPINDLLSIFLISIFHLSVCIMYLPIYYLSIYNMSIHLTYTYHLYILHHLPFTHTSIFCHTVSFNPFSIHLSSINPLSIHLSPIYHLSIIYNHYLYLFIYWVHVCSCLQSMFKEEYISYFCIYIYLNISLANSLHLLISRTFDRFSILITSRIIKYIL